MGAHQQQPGGVPASEGAGVAVAIFLRQYYRKNNATPPNFDPERPEHEYPDREPPLTQSFQKLKRGLDQLEYFCKGDSTAKRIDDHSGKAPMRVRLRSRQASRALL